ncbi:hypothetical protein MRX96_028117 [Rhipicephalus microplus]
MSEHVIRKQLASHPSSGILSPERCEQTKEMPAVGLQRGEGAACKRSDKYLSLPLVLREHARVHKRSGPYSTIAVSQPFVMALFCLWFVSAPLGRMHVLWARQQQRDVVCERR